MHDEYVWEHTADPVEQLDAGFVSSYTFVEIDLEIFSTTSAVSRRVGVSYKRKYMHEVHVLVKE